MQRKIIEKIEANKKFVFDAEGKDLEIMADIPAESKIEITNCNTVIFNGKIGAGSNINLSGKRYTFSSNQVIFSGNFSNSHISTNNSVTQIKRMLIVKGIIEDDVICESTNMEYELEKAIGRNCQLKTTNGNINAQGYIDENSELRTSNASIHVAQRHPSVKLTTSNGDIYINNEKIKNPAKLSAADDVNIGATVYNGNYYGPPMFNQLDSRFQKPRQENVDKKHERFCCR